MIIFSTTGMKRMNSTDFTDILMQNAQWKMLSVILI